MKKLSVFLFLIFNIQWLAAQSFTHQDTLRGSITPEREWWDLTYYNLAIKVNPADSSISGSNDIHFKALKPNKTMQIDLQSPMKINSVTYQGKNLKWKQDGYAYFVQFPKNFKTGDTGFIKVNFSGRPTVSKRPPWSGGFTWKYDNNGKPFISTSVQGDGASMFWPNKDHMYDEADSMTIHITAPKGLTAVSNGRLRSKTILADSSAVFTWHVTNPINNYGVNVNIGDYVHFGEVYHGLKGDLDCDYWVLPYNLEKAKVQFKDATRMLEALEYWLGPYPFYEDSYKLIEVPYLGMEHQSSVTYGNNFANGYLGRDLSNTGWGMNFDFIIIHESAHEWFANNITYKDVADMWVHEGFTTYSESLFLEYFYGKEAGSEYVRGMRQGINNDRPIIGPYNVNTSGSSDMYNKGANILHTIRQIAPSDSVWRATLIGLNKTFYHQTVKTQQIEDFISKALDFDLSRVFDQYLRDTRIPVLQYRQNYGRLAYRWNQTVPRFDMPVRITVNDTTLMVHPRSSWNFLPFQVDTLKKFEIDPNFYVIGEDLTVKSTYKKEE